MFNQMISLYDGQFEFLNKFTLKINRNEDTLIFLNDPGFNTYRMHQ
jgi:hypothetical protein